MIEIRRTIPKYAREKPRLIDETTIDRWWRIESLKWIFSGNVLSNDGYVANIGLEGWRSFYTGSLETGFVIEWHPLVIFIERVWTSISIFWKRHSPFYRYIYWPLFVQYNVTNHPIDPRPDIVVPFPISLMEWNKFCYGIAVKRRRSKLK